MREDLGHNPYQSASERPNGNGESGGDASVTAAVPDAEGGKNAEGREGLGTVSLTMLVIASMIGAGVYTTSGFALADLGDPWWVMAAWCIGGAIALCGAVGYGLLARRLTENGGEYLYLSRFVHPAVGVIAGWVSILAGFTSAGAYAAVAFDTYALPQTSRPGWLPDGLLAAGLVLCATWLHAWHTGRGARRQNGVVIVKLALLTLFIAFCFARLDAWQGTTEVAPVTTDSRDYFGPPGGWLALATSVMWISLSYSGFNAAIYVAAEARGGGANVARAMIGATAIVTGIYLLLNAIFLFAPPSAEASGRQDIAAVAAAAVGGDRLTLLVRVTICVGLASSVSSVLMAGPRVYAKMSQQGGFPSFFRTDRSPPTRSVLLQGAAILVVIYVATLRGLLSYLGLTLAVTAAATVATLFLPDREESSQNAGWARRPTFTAFHVLAAVYVLATFGIASLAAYNKPLEAIAAGVTFAVGGMAYLIHRVRRAK